MKRLKLLISKNKLFSIFLIIAYLTFLPYLARNMIKIIFGYGIDFSDNYLVMEEEILRVVPLKTSTGSAKKAMWLNGFVCSNQTNTTIQFDRSDGIWPTYWGTSWTVKMGLKDGFTSWTKVSIGPSD